MKAIHPDVRQLALEHLDRFKNITLTCSIFKISRSSLWRFRKLRENEHSLHPMKPTQPKRFSQTHEHFILHVVKKGGPHIRTFSIQRRFVLRFKMSISSRTVRRILKKHGYTYKAITYKPGSSKQPSFHERIKNIPINRLLSLDEIGFGHGFIHPLRSWSPRGYSNQLRCVRPRFLSRSKSVICLTSSANVVNYTWSYHAFNTASLLEFLRVSLHGYTGYYIILDNVSFHKSHRVSSLCREFGVTPVFIDPYCPHQNPIEEVFANIKHRIRQKCPRREDQFDKALRQAMISQRGNSLRRYFHRSVMA